MRRVLVAVWGVEAAAYAGRKMTLFRNPTIRFGPDEVGGIQISHMSGINEPVSIALTVSRGKRSPFVVQPLGDISGRDWLAELEEAQDDPDAIRALGAAARTAGASSDILTALRDAWKAADAQAVPETGETA